MLAFATGPFIDFKQSLIVIRQLSAAKWETEENIGLRWKLVCISGLEAVEALPQIVIQFYFIYNVLGDNLDSVSMGWLQGPAATQRSRLL